MSDEELKKVANEVRKGIVTGVHAAKSGHPGGSLGAADIMTYLYFEEMNVDPADPRKADRDRFVLSKGHCAPGLYAVLAERGFFPKEDLETLRHIGSHLQGHPNMNDTPGVDMSTGSLGQGISAAVGMAIGAGLYWLGLMEAVVLVVIQLVLHRFPVGGDAETTQEVTVHMEDSEDLMRAFDRLVEGHKGKITDSTLTRENGLLCLEVSIRLPDPITHQEALAFLKENPGVRKISV